MIKRFFQKLKSFFSRKPKTASPVFSIPPGLKTIHVHIGSAGGGGGSGSGLSSGQVQWITPDDVKPVAPPVCIAPEMWFHERSNILRIVYPDQPTEMLVLSRSDSEWRRSLLNKWDVRTLQGFDFIGEIA